MEAEICSHFKITIPSVSHNIGCFTHIQRYLMLSQTYKTEMLKKEDE